MAHSQDLSSDSRACTLVQQLADYIEDLQTTKDKTVRDLRTVANELSKEQENVDAVKNVSAVVGVTSAGCVIAGTGLGPFTFGASTFLTIVGLAIGGTSAFVGLATMKYEDVMNKTSMKKVQEKVEKYQETLEKLIQFFNGIQEKEIIAIMLEQFPNLEAREDIRRAVFLILVSISKGLDSLDLDIQHSFSFMAALSAVGAQFKQIGKMALYILLTPLNLHTLIDNTVRQYNEEPIKPVAAIRDVATKLENQEIVHLTEESNTIKMLMGTCGDTPKRDEDYKRLAEEYCGDNKEMLKAVFSIKQRRQR